MPPISINLNNNFHQDLFPDLPSNLLSEFSNTFLKMHLPAPIKDLISFIIGDKCYRILIEDFNITNVECLKLTISKCLGLGIVVFGSIVKVPQIIKIINSQSTIGISLVAYILETISYFITICYNIRMGFSFTTWGETLFICLQNLIVLSLMQIYSKNHKNITIIIVASYLLYKILIDPSFINENSLSILQGFTIPLTLISRVPQILTNFKGGNTGQLSSFTIFSYVLGTAARIFTTVQEVQDRIILSGFILAFTLNSILGFQMIYYWKAGYEPIKTEKKSIKAKVKAKKLD